MEYKELNKQFWGQHLWEKGYFVASSGNVTDEIAKSISKSSIYKKEEIQTTLRLGQGSNEEKKREGYL